MDHWKDKYGSSRTHPLLFGCRYGELQQPQLHSQMAAIQIPDAQSQEIDAVMAALQQSVPQAVQAVQEAQRWCYSVSGGTELPALLRLADDAVAQYIGSLQVCFSPLLLLFSML